MKQSTLLTIAVIAVLVVGVTGWLVYENNQAVPSPSQQAANTSSTVQTASATSDPLHAGLTYEEALAVYSNRIQFVSCQTSVSVPADGILSIREGTPFMLDNRSTTTSVIAFAGQSYVIPPDNFAIVSANTVGTYNLTCNGGASAKLEIAGK